MFPLKDDLPVSRTPLVTWAILAANVLAFFWQIGVGLPYSVEAGGAIPFEVLSFRDAGNVPALVPPPLTIFTSMFLHGGWMHIFSNMLFLWIFGNNVEDALGRGRFLLFYLASGVAAALAQTGATAVQAASLPPSEAQAALLVPMVGASGAIAGVLAAYMVLFPRARVLTLVPIFFIIRLFYIPARIFIGLWFGFQLLAAVSGVAAGGGVAFFAHIGGFLAGLVLVKLMGRRGGYRRVAGY